MGGLGAALPGDDAGATAPTREAATADQSVVEPDGVEAGGDEAVLSEAAGSGGETSTSPVDAVAPADAGKDSPTGPGSACDEDGDGYLAVGSACGGNDCCDQDAHVHPGETSYFAQPGACGGYDYNCDDQETPEYGATSCQWSSFSCSGDGFAAPVPGCGVFGTFTSCSIPWYDVFSCTGSNDQQAQACR
jgi:hypothetical protein